MAAKPLFANFKSATESLIPVDQPPRTARLDAELVDTGFSCPSDSRLVALHPVLDLIAVASHPEQVDVFRFAGSGSRAFGVKGARRVTTLCWKDNGSGLRIGWDGASTETVDTLSEGLISSRSATRSGGNGRPGASLSCWIGRECEPRLDWQSAWMELPPLTRPDSRKTMNIYLEARKNGAAWQVDVSVEDFEINTFRLDASVSQGSQVVDIAFNPSFAKVAVLREFERSGTTSFSLQSLSLEHLLDHDHQMHQLIRALTHLDALTAELRSCATEMDQAWKQARRVLDIQLEDMLTPEKEGDLAIGRSETPTPEQTTAPSFLQNLGIDLHPANPQGGINLVVALKQLAVTGLCSKALEEWITESMGQMGIHKWYLAFKTGLSALLEICQTKFLPALDAATVELCAIRVLSRRENIPLCQLDTKIIETFISELDLLRTIAFAVLEYAAREAENAFVFGEWLMAQFRRLNDPGSESAREAEQKIAETDYVKLYSYIEVGLTKSRLKIFFGRDLNLVEQAPRRPKMSPRREVIEAMLKRHELASQQPVSQIVEYLNVPYLSLFLLDSQSLLAKNFLHACQPKSGSIEAYEIAAAGSSRFLDLHISDEGAAPIAYVLLSEAGPSLRVHRLPLTTKVILNNSKVYGLPADELTETVDAKFVDGHRLLHLGRTHESSPTYKLYIIDYSRGALRPRAIVDVPLQTAFRPSRLVVRKREHATHVALCDAEQRVLRISELKIHGEAGLEEPSLEGAVAANEAAVEDWLNS